MREIEAGENSTATDPVVEFMNHKNRDLSYKKHLLGLNHYKIIWHFFIIMLNCLG